MVWWICSQFGCRVLACQTQSDNDMAICCFYKVKHAWYECDTHADTVASCSFFFIHLSVEWGIIRYVDVRVDTEDKTMPQIVNPHRDNACRLSVYSSLLRLIDQSQHKYTCTHTHMHSQTHTYSIHLPVWIISGFPQWVIEPMLFSLSDLP